jgi:NAD(P)-dependent dehydrogenase (short-subunit alcohol dehydrogenase family)
MGLATAKLLATRGAIISLADINEKALDIAIQSLSNSEKHISSVVDVRNSKSVNEWIQSTVEKLGKLDGAVNMAGVITPAASVADETDDNWDFTFAVNTRGVFFCLRAQLNAMKPGGSIVSSAQISTLIWQCSIFMKQVSAASVFGQMGAPGVSAYCASKAAVIGLTRTAAKENQNIRVNCVSPGEHMAYAIQQ